MRTERIEFGDFELVECLQSGEGRIVWRAMHRASGRQAAVKVLTGPLGTGRIEALEREVRAQARLQHPGVVRLFNYGTVGDRAAGKMVEKLASVESGDIRGEHPYLVMEWANRGSLWHTLPIEEWEEVHRILTSILRTLAYAHARDVLHRDLKPENVLVFQPEGALEGETTYKIGDFGLARPTGIDTPFDAPVESKVSGTPGYLPPEQARSEWRAYGPWTDLYSVGCLGWRLVCRTLPFTAESSFGVILKHVDADRPALEPEIPVPASLESWFHRMMAIEPADRFSNAAEALANLPTANGHSADERIQVGVPEDWRVIESPDASVDSSRRETQVEGLELFGLREVPFVGRACQRDLLWQNFREVADEGGMRVIGIEGAPGVGKSRLTQWLVRLGQETGVATQLQVMNSQGRSGTHEGLKGMIRRRLRCWNMPSDELRRWLVARLPRFDGEEGNQQERDASALAKWLEPTCRGDDEMERKPPFKGEKQRRRVLARMLSRFAVDRPAVLSIDDVPWDNETLDVLETFRRESVETPDLLVVATGRTDEFDENPTVRPRLEGLRHFFGGERIELQPLSKHQQRRLLNGMLSMADALLERLVEQAEGNPLFAVQLLRHWVDRGYVRGTSDGFQLQAGEVDDLPADLFELWEGRVRRLTQTEGVNSQSSVRQALEFAAARGRSLTAERWEKVANRVGLTSADHLKSQLVARGLAVETEVGWEYAHGLLVEALETSAKQAGRWEDYHRQWAEILADETVGHGDGRTSARRAEHLIEFGAKEAALEPLLEAAHRRGLLGDLTARYEALTQRRQLLNELGIPESDRRRVINQADLAAHLIAEERPDEAKEMAQHALELAEKNGWDLIRAKTLKTLAEGARNRADYDRSVDYLDRAIEAARQADDQRMLAGLYADRSWASLIRGDADSARDYLQKCAKSAEASDATYWVVNAKYQMGQVALSEGKRQEAQDHYEVALSEARRRGSQRLEGLAINSLGDLAKEAGDMQRALEHYEQLDDIAEAIQLGRLSLLAQLNRAQVVAVRGELDKAEHLIASANRLLEDAEITDHDGLLEVIRLVVAVKDGELSRALSLLEPYADGWPENQRLDHDVPWLLEQALDEARRTSKLDRDAEPNGENSRTRLIELLADRAEVLYRRLGDDSAAERIGEIRSSLDLTDSSNY